MSSLSGNRWKYAIFTQNTIECKTKFNAGASQIYCKYLSNESNSHLIVVDKNIAKQLNVSDRKKVMRNECWLVWLRTFCLFEIEVVPA
jgi:hypothetical protein